MPGKPLAEWTREDYERAAQAYLDNLPLEHFMERTPHATQRKITVESFDLVTAERPDLQMCNELLVQYPANGHVGQVVPDNAVIESPTPLEPMGSFNLPFESDRRILWVLEYVSPSNRRKDYESNFRKYERDLKVPYYLIFDPESTRLDLYRHNGVTYEAVVPNDAERLPIPELEMEVAVLNGWVRYWFRGRLLPLPADLQKQVDELQDRLDEAREEAVMAWRQAEREKRRAEEAAQQAEAEKQRAEEQERLARQEQERRAAAEGEVERLRALLAQLQGGQPSP